MAKAQLKSVTVCARTDARTYRQYKRAAATAGLPLTDWIRARLHSAAEMDLAT